MPQPPVASHVLFDSLLRKDERSLKERRCTCLGAPSSKAPTHFARGLDFRSRWRMRGKGGSIAAQKVAAPKAAAQKEVPATPKEAAAPPKEPKAVAVPKEAQPNAVAVPKEAAAAAKAVAVPKEAAAAAKAVAVPKEAAAAAKTVAVPKEAAAAAKAVATPKEAAAAAKAVATPKQAVCCSTWKSMEVGSSTPG